MKLVMWGMLILASLGLVYQAVINRGKVGRIVSRVGVQFVIGIFILYMLNMTEAYTHVSIPINVATLATVGILGMPGLLLLGVVKLVIV